MKTLADLDIAWVFTEPPPVQLPGFRHAVRCAWKDQIGSCCLVCGQNMIFGGAGRVGCPRHYATIDHIIALGSGGMNRLDNLWIICWLCNNKKSIYDQQKAPNPGCRPVNPGLWLRKHRPTIERFDTLLKTF